MRKAVFLMCLAFSALPLSAQQSVAEIAAQSKAAHALPANAPTRDQVMTLFDLLQVRRNMVVLMDGMKKAAQEGAAQSFRKIPNGVPGVETRLPLLFSEGVNKGRLSLQQFVALSSTNAAKIYGLHPRKGTIAVGADADIVLWDPERKVSLTNTILHHNCDYTPYEGRELTGYPVMTLSRGEVVMEEAKMSGSAGRGLFQKCDRPEAARPRGKPLIDPSIFN